MKKTEKFNNIKFSRKFYVIESHCNENRPIKWTNNETNESIVMYYDYRGRRCGKLFYNSDGVWQESAKFFYNNFTLIEESAANNTIIKEFVWDPIETVATRPLTMKCNVQNTSLLYTHDANKNVTEVLYLATQNGLAAHYEYSPFGELRNFSHLSSTPETSNSEINAITETSNSETNAITEISNSEVNAIAEISNYGHLASSQSLNPETNAITETLNSSNPSPGDLIGWCDTPITEIDIRTFNPFRFSSEYHDDELNLIYYNYRHYDPATGRFLSRDPIEEQGGTNLYNFTANNPINYFDSLGFKVKECEVVIYIGHTDSANEFHINNNENVKGKYCAYGALGCYTSEQGGLKISEKFPNPTGVIGWGTQPKRGKPINAGYKSFELMADAAIREGRGKMNKMAKNCDCKCKKITLRVECQKEINDDGFTERLNKAKRENLSGKKICSYRTSARCKKNPKK